VPRTDLLWIGAEGDAFPDFAAAPWVDVSEVIQKP
jgi:hypothetical protein